MKISFAILFVSLIGVAVGSQTTLFKQFIAKYEKSYSSDEYRLRYEIFKENLEIIEELNAHHPRAKFGVTKFADLSSSEFKQMMLSSQPMNVVDENWPVAPLYSDAEIGAIPTSWDWRSHGAVTPVKNQGDCGSCWSFSATGNMEGQWALSGHSLVGLSEQNLVDCDHHCMEYQNQSSCDAGCDGGLMPNAFMYVIGNGGIDTESSYPYQGEDGSCHFSNSSIGATISSWTMIAGNETQMAIYLYKNGPVSIAVEADAWQFYIFGVFEDPWCGTNLDHGVLIVGYGTGTDWFGQSINFWIVKNSWGEDWGESGYIRLERGSDQCGDNLFPCSSIA